MQKGSREPRRKARLPNLLELSADISQLFEDLLCETDRGAALVAAAFLDDAVRALVRAALIEESKTADAIFDYPRPLHSFAARTDIAYCMGLIGKPIYDDLVLVRHIRNEFAHQRHPATFGDPAVRQMCESLRAVQTAMLFVHSSRLDAKERFIFSVLVLANEIMAMLLGTRHAERGKGFLMREQTITKG